MVRTATGPGAVAFALVVAIGAAVPAAAAPGAGAVRHGGESAGSTPTHAAGHLDHRDHGDHGSAGGQDSHSDHGTAGGEDATSDQGGHSQHGTGSEAGDEGGHGSSQDTVSDSTRAGVLGGFGAVNAAAIGGALLLRRRDRRINRTGTGRGRRSPR